MDFEHKLEQLDEVLHQAQDLVTDPDDKQDIDRMIITLNRLAIRREAKEEGRR